MVRPFSGSLITLIYLPHKWNFWKMIGNISFLEESCISKNVHNLMVAIPLRKSKLIWLLVGLLVAVRCWRFIRQQHINPGILADDSGCSIINPGILAAVSGSSIINPGILTDDSAGGKINQGILADNSGSCIFILIIII